MRKIESLLGEYGESHQNPTNKLVHWICVPIIFWSITALLWGVKLPFNLPSTNIQMNLSLVLLVLLVIYYIKLSPPLSIGMFFFCLVCCLINLNVEASLPSSVSLWLVALVAFVLAWIGQFWGHKVEGKKPSFLKDLQFLLVGPAWLMHFIYKKMSLKY